MPVSSIQAFEPLLYGYKHAKAATAYYVYLIHEFPTSFERLYKAARELLQKNITSNQMRIARNTLLNDGLIAQVILTNDQPTDNFGREMYLPISPVRIWESYKERDINNILSDEYFEKEIRSLDNIYKKNFKKYGLGTEVGSVTVLINPYWLFNLILNQPLQGANIYLMLSGLRSLSVTYNSFYHKFLKQGAKIKILFNSKDAKAINAAKSLASEYPQSVKINYTSVNYGTSRKFIILPEKEGGLAVDIKKILSEKKNSHEDFEGTIYLQKKFQDLLIDEFEEEWESSDPIGSIP